MCLNDDTSVVVLLCLNVQCGSTDGLDWSRVRDNHSDLEKEKEIKELKEQKKERGGGSKERNKRERMIGQELLEVTLEMLICPRETR